MASTHMATNNCLELHPVPRDLMPYSDFLRLQATHVVHRHTSVQNTHTHREKKQIFLKSVLKNVVLVMVHTFSPSLQEAERDRSL